MTTVASFQERLTSQTDVLTGLLNGLRVLPTFGENGHDYAAWTRSMRVDLPAFEQDLAIYQLAGAETRFRLPEGAGECMSRGRERSRSVPCLPAWQPALS